MALAELSAGKEKNGSWTRSVKRKLDLSSNGQYFSSSSSPPSSSSSSAQLMRTSSLLPEEDLMIALSSPRRRPLRSCHSLGFEWTKEVAELREKLGSLYCDLEQERAASDWATREAMAMITRLQEEKSALAMEARHFQTFAEEREAHEQETIALLKQLLASAGNNEDERGRLSRQFLLRTGSERLLRLASDQGWQQITENCQTLSFPSKNHEFEWSQVHGESIDSLVSANKIASGILENRAPLPDGCKRRDQIEDLTDCRNAGFRSLRITNLEFNQICGVQNKEFSDRDFKESIDSLSVATEKTPLGMQKNVAPLLDECQHRDQTGDLSDRKKDRIANLGMISSEFSRIASIDTHNLNGRIRRIRGVQNEEVPNRDAGKSIDSVLPTEKILSGMLDNRVPMLDGCQGIDRTGDLFHCRKDRIANLGVIKSEFNEIDAPPIDGSRAGNGAVCGIGSSNSIKNSTRNSIWDRIRSLEERLEHLGECQNETMTTQDDTIICVPRIKDSHLVGLDQDTNRTEEHTSDLISKDSGNDVHDIYEIEYDSKTSDSMARLSLGRGEDPMKNCKGCMDDLLKPSKQEIESIELTEELKDECSSKTGKLQSLPAKLGGRSSLDVADEVNLLRMQLEALEAERILMAQAVESLRKENKELKLLQDISQQIRELQCTMNKAAELPLKRPPHVIGSSFMSIFKCLEGFFGFCGLHTNTYKRLEDGSGRNMELSTSHVETFGLSNVLEKQASVITTPGSATTPEATSEKGPFKNFPSLVRYICV